MTYDVSASFSQEQAKLEGSFPLNLYVINSSISGTDYLYFANLNQDVYGFTMDASGNLTDAEQLYTALPLQQSDFEMSSDGQIPSLDISVPNVDRAMESVIQNNDYLRGCEMYIITTFSTYLPSGAGDAGYIGSSADRHACMKEKLFIDSTTSNEEVVTFTCKPKFVIDNMTLPRRRFSRECNWEYGSAECNVSTTMIASYTDCDYTLHDCKLRQNEERFGGFPGIPNRGIIIV